MTLHELTDHLLEFREARNWHRFHTPKNLAQAIASEAGELNHFYRWEDSGQLAFDEAERVAPEVADIMIFCLYLCESLSIDPEQAIFDKIEANGRKYPA